MHLRLKKIFELILCTWQVFHFAITWNIEIICQQMASERLESALSYNPKKMRGQMFSSLISSEAMCQTPKARGHRGRCHPIQLGQVCGGHSEKQVGKDVIQRWSQHLLQLLQAQEFVHSWLLTFSHCGADRKDSSHSSRKKKRHFIKIVHQTVFKNMHAGVYTYICICINNGSYAIINYCRSVCQMMCK